ncbi:MAG: SDR family NAD(P)-dependent oxidoreductase [Chitinophagaceae bacterium]|nr:MAG: SDR family NAD(P)-dependent oxidoreductase [Chitinophagaceae bacterium]
MLLTGNTILITGGSAGIGFEMAKQLSVSNRVIITGRDEARLRLALERLPGVTGIRSDISDPAAAASLAGRLAGEYPDLNIVVNNAGRAIVHRLGVNNAAYEYAKDEMITNYLSVVGFNEALIPLLRTKPAAAIVNVSSIVAFAGSGAIPTYSASKAALHSYTQLLRLALGDSSVKVFELMPPLVNTDFSKAIGGEKGMSPVTLVEFLLDAIAADQYEIRPGATEDIYRLSLASPEKALETMNPLA